MMQKRDGKQTADCLTWFQAVYPQDVTPSLVGSCDHRQPFNPDFGRYRRCIFKSEIQRAQSLTTSGLSSPVPAVSYS
jgi:hypothetical protein